MISLPTEQKPTNLALRLAIGDEEEAAGVLLPSPRHRHAPVPKGLGALERLERRNRAPKVSPRARNCSKPISSRRLRRVMVQTRPDGAGYVARSIVTENLDPADSRIDLLVGFGIQQPVLRGQATIGGLGHVRSDIRVDRVLRRRLA